MKKLTVLFDERCGLCLAAARWLNSAPAYFELEMVPSRSPRVAGRWPGLVFEPGEELVAIDDQGGGYRGDRAFIICLYALQEWRERWPPPPHPAPPPFA